MRGGADGVAPKGAGALGPAAAFAVAKAAVRSLTAELKSARSRVISALELVSAAISSRVCARSLRTTIQPAENAAAARHPTSVAAGHTQLECAASFGGGAMESLAGMMGKDSRISVMMRPAKLSKLATMKRRMSTA